MSNNIEIHDTKHKNGWVNWVEEAINKEYFKLYENNNFHNVQEIGSSTFGKVYRANWKNSEQYIALKSFSNINDVAVKEIAYEVIKKYDNFTNFTTSIFCNIYLLLNLYLLYI
jgi:serine/threonine protein kinase